MRGIYGSFSSASELAVRWLLYKRAEQDEAEESTLLFFPFCPHSSPSTKRAMHLSRLAAFLALVSSSAFAAQAPAFVKPAASPIQASPIYVGATNVTLTPPTIVGGKVFDRFIQIWLENTDFNVASTSPTFMKLAQQGITLTNYFATTHPSEPNYVASIGGDFFGMGDDNLYNIPPNISTIVDLLEDKGISWATYQENVPTDGWLGFNFAQQNYLQPSSGSATFYFRKHNPFAIFDSVVDVPSRRLLIRNFNDFAADVNASAIPQWTFVTPNIVNDAHDTDIDFASDWLEFWLIPLLELEAFNDDRTLILLTFDENETSRINNQIFSLLLGGAVPANLKGTTDNTFFTHYSSLSTIQANWGLGSLGRQDTNKTMANVWSFVADAVGYENVAVTGNAVPHTNISGTIPGPLNAKLFIPFTAPNINAVGAGGGPVFVGPGVDFSFTPGNLPAPVNLASSGITPPFTGFRNGTIDGTNLS